MTAPALRTTDDFLRQALQVNRRKSVSIFPTRDGRFQANVGNPDGSYTCEVCEDPVDALYNALVPYHMRRRPVADAVIPVSETIDLEEAIAAAAPGPVVDPLADLGL